MSGSIHISLALLHTRTSIEFYKKRGFQAIPSIKIQRLFSWNEFEETVKPDPWDERLEIDSIFERDLVNDERETKILKEMQQVHGSFISALNGPIIRDDLNYWKKWIRHEVTNPTKNNMKITTIDKYLRFSDSKRIASYAIFQFQNSISEHNRIEIMVKEYCWDRNIDLIQADPLKWFLILLRKAFLEWVKTNKGLDLKIPEITLLLHPLQELQQLWKSGKTEDKIDHGWMFFPVKPFSLAPFDQAAPIEIKTITDLEDYLQKGNPACPFPFLDLDSF